MDRAFKASWGGRNEERAGLLINRLVPNGPLQRVGPFVSLGHVYPTHPESREAAPRSCPQPHRGIILLSYLLSGSLEYVDSRGHREPASAGDVLWIKAGNGVIHNERVGPGVLHAVQWWINLPAVNKIEEPQIVVLPARDVPELVLPDSAGVLRVLLGCCGVCVSPPKTFLDEFIYHIRLNPKSSFSYSPRPDLETAAFIPDDEVYVNGRMTGNSHLLACFDREPVIRLDNPGIGVVDAFIFGGREYREPMVVRGPFVMNSREEIAMAYADFFEGRYGSLH